MIARGQRYEVGSFEESLAIVAIQRQAEIEYAKLRAVTNAIISVGNIVAAAITGGESGGLDTFNKSMDTVKDALLPQLKEERDKTAARYKKTLQSEMDKGPIKVKVVGRDKKKKR